MPGHNNPEHGESIELPDAWWAKRAKRLLHPIQVEVIEVFRRKNQPLSVGNLSEVFGDIESVKLDHHVGRLRQVGALEVVGGQTGVDFMDVLYQLTKEEPPRRANGTPLATHFGIHLSACRERAGLSQEELGYHASLPMEKVSSLERGEREPSLSEVARLAPALSISINDLLDGIEWKPDGRGCGRFEPPGESDASAD